jgi:aspartate racemase
MIGGMSWHSSATYYRLLNEGVAQRLGPLHSAKSLLYTVDFHEISELQHRGAWDEAGGILVDAAQRLQRGGADCVLLCTNTMHKLAPRVQDAVHLPLLHIADPTARAILACGLRRVGLLATAFTMEQPYYKGRLAEQFGLEILVPDAPERALVHRVIYDELCRGQISEESKARYVHILHELVARGAEGVILGCTEIMLLVGQSDSPVPVFDTTTLHAQAAVEFALGS